MQLFYLFLSSLAVLASANAFLDPNSGSTQTTKCSAPITAKYDDLPTLPPAALPVRIGTYRGLMYNNVVFTTLGVLGSPPTTGLIPASNPNVAAFGIFTILSTQNVTVFKGGAGYKVFNPIRIAYGCVVGSEQTIDNVPASCTLAFSGYKAGVRVVRQLVTYEVAKGQLTKAMSVAILQGFSGVDTVRFELIVPNALTVAALLDNFVYAGCS